MKISRTTEHSECRTKFRFQLAKELIVINHHIKERNLVYKHYEEMSNVRKA